MLCSLAHQFPAFVEAFLNQGGRLSRRFREETITDVLMGGLVSMGPPAVYVDYPNETSTGADMRWDFVNRRSGAYFSVFIQAKKLYERSGPWRDHGYDELFHLSGSTGRYQAEILCGHARGQPATYPLYAFYNQGLSCALARADGVTNVEGVTLADGFEVERRVLAAATAPMRRSASSLGSLQPLFFPLSDILCRGPFIPLGVMAFTPGVGSPPPVTFDMVNGRRVAGFRLPPRPEDIRNRLVDIIRGKSVASDSHAPEIPEVSDTPADVRARIARHQEERVASETGRAPYWIVTIVSTDPPSLD